MTKAQRRTLAALLAAATCGGLAAPATATMPTTAGGVMSTTQAGYVVASENIHELTAGWTVPKATCSSARTHGRVSVALSSAHLELEAGTTFDCRGGRATYSFSSTAMAKRAVLPKDHMTLSMSYARGSFTIEIDDDTQGWGQAANADATGGPRMTQVRFVIQGSPNATGHRPLTTFGRATFDGATVDGKQLDDQHPRRLVMVTQRGLVRATPGALTPDGDFAVTWKHG